MLLPAPPAPKSLLGCVHRRAIWVPTLRGWLLLLIFVAALGWLAMKKVPAFLSLNRPIAAEALVVEGWIPDYGLLAARDEFKSRGYQGLYVTGVPLEKGKPLSHFKTYAEFGAAVLVASGMDSNQVIAVPAPEVRADRTFTTARSLRDLLAKQHPAIHSLNVVSIGPHSRRTRLLYEKAFGKNWQIGMIAIPDHSYDPHYWYRSSNGVRGVLDEAIAYIYARFFFREDKS
jgi:hypothetical protein